jgi:hypothetical protein
LGLEGVPAIPMVSMDRALVPLGPSGVALVLLGPMGGVVPATLGRRGEDGLLSQPPSLLPTKEIVLPSLAAPSNL